METLELLTRPLFGGVTALVVAWLLMNSAGIILSYVTMVIALGDRRRAAMGRHEFERRIGAISKTRRSIAVLGEAAVQGETLRLSIHCGHLLIGALATTVPPAPQESLREWVLAASLWFIGSAGLMMVTTLLHLKARYDYRTMRLEGKRTGWGTAVRAAWLEFRYEMSRRKG